MKKRVLALVLSAVMALPCAGGAVFAAAEFPDLASGHWAYSAVRRLVDEGTIGGLPDGTFAPDSSVSRAEFVKMIGKTDKVTTDRYTDVNPGDWYYDYVMASGLAPVSTGVFKPDEPIKRGDVATLLWSRNGSAKVDNVPSVITSQGENADAAAWVYSKGIMVGNDYIDMRLGDTLSRAEAAVLIVRARENVSSAAKNPIDNIPDSTFKAIYDSFNLLDDREYDPDGTLTHGEIANIAMRLACRQHTLTYNNYSVKKDAFEHKYVRPLGVYAAYCIGEDKVTPEYIDQKATVADAVCAVAFGLVKTSYKYLNYGEADGYYSDVTKTDSEIANKLLTMAKNNGIYLYADGTIKADSPVTMRQLACLLIEADSISGLNNAYVFEANRSGMGTSVRTDTATYPETAEKYALILDEVPNTVYDSPFVTYKDGDGIGMPKAVYDSVRDFNSVYSEMLLDISSAWNERDDLKASITHYPSMVINNGNGYTFRVKIDIKSAADGTSLADIIPLDDSVGNIALKEGMIIWADIETGGLPSGVYLSAENAGINRIVLVEQ